MTGRTAYAFLLILQGTAIALLLFVAFRHEPAPVYIRIPSTWANPSPVMNSGNQYGLTDEDAAALSKESVEKREAVDRYRISKPLLRETQSLEIGEIGSELLKELEQYPAMSEKQRRQLEAKLAGRILEILEMKSNAEGEVEKRISDALRDMDRVEREDR